MCDSAPSPSPRALADPAANLLLPPRSPVRVGTAHTTKSTRPHPLLARLMRERLREHSGHLEAQHREAGGDFDSDDDGGTSDAGGDVAGTSRETSPEGRDDDADGSIVDDFDLHEDDEGGGFDSDAGRREETTLISKASRSKTSRAQKRAGASATPEGARLVDLVRAEAATRDDAFAETSPSQRRVNALLRMERRAKAEAEALGRGGNPARRAAAAAGGSASFARRANPDARPAARSSFLDFAGSFFGRTPEKGGAPSVVSPASPAPARISEKRAAALFDRLYHEKKKPSDRDPDETFKPRISRKTRAMGADVHARENDGLPRVEYLLKKGTNVLRERAARTAELERLGGGERTATDVSARVVDPTRFFLDEGSGRPVKPGDSYVRAIKVLRDTELAKDKRVCTFKPRVTKASRAICEARDAADPAAARRGPLGMYARGVEFMERRKRAAAAAEAARLADEEKECTFRPKPATRVPGFMRVIAAKMRRGGDASFIKGDETLETRTLKKGPEEALVNAARRREGWLASPTFSLSGWAESLGITSGDVSGGGSLGKGASERSRSFGGFGGSAAGSVDGGSAENHASATVRAGGVSFPSAPADHPARRRAGAHVPIKSAMSHYGFRDAGARSATDALEDARLAAKAAEAAHAANLESLFGDVADVRDEPPPTAFAAAPPASPLATRLASGSAGYYRDVDRRADRGGVRARLLGAPESTSADADAAFSVASVARSASATLVPVAETDYFERMHLERKQRARLEASEKAARLTRYDGSSWTNRVTEPKAPKLGRKPDMSGVTALRRPLTSRASANAISPQTAKASLSNSVGGSDAVALSAGAAAAAARRRHARETPSGVTGTSARAPPASPLAARLAGGVDGYYRDVRRRARDPGSFPASERTSPERSGAFATHARERDARRSKARGPPGWSDDRGARTETRVYGRTDVSSSQNAPPKRDGAAETARRAVFGGGGGFGSGSESDRNFHDDFGEFKSEGEYDSEFE